MAVIDKVDFFSFYISQKKDEFPRKAQRNVVEEEGSQIFSRLD